MRGSSRCEKVRIVSLSFFVEDPSRFQDSTPCGFSRSFVFIFFFFFSGCGGLGFLCSVLFCWEEGFCRVESGGDCCPFLFSIRYQVLESGYR